MQKTLYNPRYHKLPHEVAELQKGLPLRDNGAIDFRLCACEPTEKCEKCKPGAIKKPIPIVNVYAFLRGRLLVLDHLPNIIAPDVNMHVVSGSYNRPVSLQEIVLQKLQSGTGIDPNMIDTIEYFSPVKERHNDKLWLVYRAKVQLNDYFDPKEIKHNKEKHKGFDWIMPSYAYQSNVLESVTAGIDAMFRPRHDDEHTHTTAPLKAHSSFRFLD